MSNNWTKEDARAYELRSRLWTGNPDVEVSGVVVEKADDAPEYKLQAKIEAWCKQNGFPFHHDRSRGCNTAGFPDLVIALAGGITLWVELKSAKGRLSDDQRKWQAMLIYLGHKHFVIKSFRQFLQAVELAKGKK